MLAELDYDHSLHERQYGGDEKLFVRMYMDILPDPEASAKEGMRKFRDAEMIQIIVPGDKRNIVTREIREDDKVRFAEKYKKFQDTKADPIEGFPLSEWAALSRATIEELKYLGFMTIEHVASANDSALSKYPGLRELQRRAQSWLEMQKSTAPLEKLAAELKTRDEQIASLQSSLAEQAKVLAELKKAK